MKRPRGDKSYLNNPNQECITGLILPRKSLMLDKQATHFTKYLSVSKSQRAGKSK